MSAATAAVPAAPDAAAIAPVAAPPARGRLEAIDRLRGVVMVLMALDHARDFLGSGANPTDLSTTTPFLFFTRWITHFCAPVFVLLAGTSAYLSTTRKSPAELSRFLLARGAWLVLLELTVVRFAWIFDPGWHFVFAQVIWAIGWSMIALAALSRLPVRAVAAFGVVVVAGHGLLDGIHADALGRWRPLWLVLHEQGLAGTVLGAPAFVAYPLVPWVAVMACGWALGAWMRLEPVVRRRRVARLGAALCVVFVVVRALDRYGDPHRWVAQPRAALTVAAFLNCAKYPPSLDYLTMTLGPALLVLAMLDRPLDRPLGRALDRALTIVSVYGRVPLFYYVAHLLVIHVVAVVATAPREGLAALWHVYLRAPAGASLPVVYLAWLAIVIALWWPCRWFADVKARRRDWWLGYL